MPRNTTATPTTTKASSDEFDLLEMANLGPIDDDLLVQPLQPDESAPPRQKAPSKTKRLSTKRVAAPRHLKRAVTDSLESLLLAVDNYGLRTPYNEQALAGLQKNLERMCKERPELGHDLTTLCELHLNTKPQLTPATQEESKQTATIINYLLFMLQKHYRRLKHYKLSPELAGEPEVSTNA